MSAPRSRRRSAGHNTNNLGARVARLEATVRRLTQTHVRREEHEEVLAALRKMGENAGNLERHTRDLDVQFTRIAQIQADLDEIRRVCARIKH